MEEKVINFQQQYIKKPLCFDEVQGISAKTIFKRMIKGHHPDYHINKLDFVESSPSDVDDWERCRSLLLMYPEFKVRLDEMKPISRVWFELIENWSILEELYLLDYEIFGHKGFGIGKCDSLIRRIVDHESEMHHIQCKYKKLTDRWRKGKDGCGWCDRDGRL